jgi:hypothetical protein
MKRIAAFAAASCALLAAGSALSEEPPAQAPAGTAAPSAITITVPTCRLAEHAGIEEADASTAAQLVCAELARADHSSGARYRVSLGKLGSVVILSVAREGDSLGSTADAREMRLQAIEEVSVAAPRIADSIVRGTTLRDTETVDNLVGEETRNPKAKPGKVHVAIGILGVLPPLSQGVGPAPGANLELHYETSAYEIGGGMRFGGGAASSGSPSMGFFGLWIGGRYFTSNTDFSPFVGGGLSWSLLKLRLPDGRFDGDNSGLGAFAEGGVEIMRTHHAHLAFGLRFDLPFFELNNRANSQNIGGYMTPNVTPAGSTGPSVWYYAPLSLEARLTF